MQVTFRSALTLKTARLEGVTLIVCFMFNGCALAAYLVLSSSAELPYSIASIIHELLCVCYSVLHVLALAIARNRAL